MDIVSRLKYFMDSQRIANSQFADTCRIPRPTLSQLLNGRNKKISDELITKIHQAYPQLSIGWLMFGEGDMMVGGNTQTSAPSDDSYLPFEEPEATVTQTINFDEPSVETSNDLQSEKFGGRQSAASPQSQQKQNTDKQQLSERQVQFTAETANVVLNADDQKRITRILVFYNDSSFQEFTPVTA